jgi:PDZ domain-containing protein
VLPFGGRRDPLPSAWRGDDIISGMSRRTATLTLAGVALAALLAIAFVVPMPYVVMSPGVTEDTLGAFKGRQVVSIHGHKTYPTEGNLDLTTVSVTSPDYHPRLGDILQAWWRKDEIILPREAVYPPDQSVQDVNEQNEQEMTSSQDSAIVAGLGEAGIDAFHVRIADVEAGAPADGVLDVGDEILAVDGKPVQSSDDAASAITGLAPGSRVSIRIRRAGAVKTVTLKTVESTEVASQSRIGVSIEDDFDPPFDVRIRLGQQIGGPSAGLMFSLAIYDMLTPGSLTGGAHVAGTGTIDDSGAVGVIGGIQQKIAGAVNAGASVFLAPAGNCSEAVDATDSDRVELIKVSTIDDAVHALEALSSGDGDAVPRCSS